MHIIAWRGCFNRSNSQHNVHFATQRGRSRVSSIRGGTDFFPPSKRTPRLSPPLPYTRSCLRMANEEAIIFARVFRNGEVSGFIGDRRDVFGGIHWHLLAPFPLLRRGVSYSMTRKTCPMALAKRKSASGGALDSVLPTTCAELYM